MRVVSQAGAMPPGPNPACAAVGFFDGVHRGHQAVLGAMLRSAQSHHALRLAVTFDRHPTAIVAPDRVPRLLQRLEQRLSVLDHMGVDVAWVIHFDETFSRLPAETFVRRLALEFGPLRSVHVGDQFRFGHHRLGNAQLLARCGADLGFALEAIPAVVVQGAPVSSTRIREAIQCGDLDLATELLGHPYSLAGTVVRGNQIGRQLGFPTANVCIDGLVLPPAGVYVAEARWQGRTTPAVANLGVRPTLDPAGQELHLEAHILGCDPDLYDAQLEVVLLAHLREERRFPSLNALQTQIQQDVQVARDHWERRHGPLMKEG